MTNRRLARSLPSAIAVAALVCVASACARGPRSGPAPIDVSTASEIIAGPAEMALVAPLARGSMLGDWRVRDVYGVNHGRLRVVLERNGTPLALDVALTDSSAPIPAATAGRYAVFYAARPGVAQSGFPLARALTALIAPHADTVAPPPGLTAYTDPRNGPP